MVARNDTFIREFEKTKRNKKRKEVPTKDDRHAVRLTLEGTKRTSSRSARGVRTKAREAVSGPLNLERCRTAFDKWHVTLRTSL